MDDDEDSEEEAETPTPKKPESSKKRANEAALKTPVSSKKAKAAVAPQKTGKDTNHSLTLFTEFGKHKYSFELDCLLWHRGEEERWKDPHNC